MKNDGFEVPSQVDTQLGDLERTARAEVVPLSSAVRELYVTMRDVLKVDGQPAEIDGLQVTLSKTSVKLATEHPHNRVRIYSYVGDEDAFGKRQVYTGLLYDDDDEVSPQENNPAFSERIKITAEGILDTGIDTPKLNDPVMVEFVTKIVGEINSTVHAQLQASEREKEYAQRQRINKLKSIGGYVLGAVAVAGTAVGIIFGLSKVDWKNLGPHPGADEATFDNQKNTLPSDQGVVILAGQSRRLTLSTDLQSSKPLSVENVPESKNVEEDAKNFKGRQDSNDLTIGDGLRQITINTSNGDGRCKTRQIDGDVPLGTKMIAYSDFISPEGTSRAGELVAKFTLKEVKVCWTGTEIGPEDDPRMVFDLLAPSKKR